MIHRKIFYKIAPLINARLEKIYSGQETLVIILSAIFILAFIIQLYFYSVYLIRALFKKKIPYSKEGTGKVPVSIILCAKNEAENLRKNLPLILEQDYENYEVIVVNDRSEDETEDILRIMCTKYPHLRVSSVRNDPKFTFGKKLALMLGIKAAVNEWLLLTDADCYPAGKNWLSVMQSNFREDIDIVLGYGGYKKEPGLLNLIIRFDTAFTALFYIGMARAGKPYMGVGRNLAYRKSLFFKNKGFASHANLSSGDDDLFVNETANAGNTATEINPESFTWSTAEKKYHDWYWQKKRHLTTGIRYKPGSKNRLIIENTSRILLLISMISLLWESPFATYILAAFGFIYLFKAIVFKIFFTRLKESYLFLPSLIIEPVIPYFYAYLHFRNYIERNRNKWN